MYLDVTFEQSGSVVRADAHVSAGWREKRSGGYFFLGKQAVDFRHDLKLEVEVRVNASVLGVSFGDIKAEDFLKRVEVQVNARAVGETTIQGEWPQATSRRGRVPSDFPLEFRSDFGADPLTGSIGRGRLTVRARLCEELPWKVEKGKDVVVWQIRIGECCNVGYRLMFKIVLSRPQTARGDYKAWDLLPFLPGGQFESDRRKH